MTDNDLGRLRRLVKAAYKTVTISGRDLEQLVVEVDRLRGLAPRAVPDDFVAPSERPVALRDGFLWRGNGKGGR